MFFLPKFREQKMKPMLIDEINFYTNIDNNNIAEYQLKKFNKLWKNIQVNVPYYKNKVDNNELQPYFNNLSELSNLPVLDREFVTKHMHELTNDSREPDTWGTTGGSTGNPLQFPKWKSETVYCEPSVWYVRNFYNISRSDRMFRLWGHSHTLGKGLTKYKNKLKFDFGLPLIGYKRFPAYDLSDQKLKEAGEAILRFKPRYIIGYSKALYMLARANADKKSEFHRLKLKAVIGAAEGFANEEDKNYVAEIFGCPVALQYAAMETNYIAHTHPDGEYKVLWRNNLIECVDDDGNPSNSGRILITSLYPRAFPLVRYEIGDIIDGCKKNDESVYSFEKVKGRDNDFLLLDENTPIHSEGITHAVKSSSMVTAYQIRYTKDRQYTIYLKSSEEIKEEEIKVIKEKLKQIDKRLGKIRVKQADQLKQTIAGKTKWLMEE